MSTHDDDNDKNNYTNEICIYKTFQGLSKICILLNYIVHVSLLENNNSCTSALSIIRLLQHIAGRNVFAPRASTYAKVHLALL